MVALVARNVRSLEDGLQGRSRDLAASPVGPQQPIAKGLSTSADDDGARDEFSRVFAQARDVDPRLGIVRGGVEGFLGSLSMRPGRCSNQLKPGSGMSVTGFSRPEAFV